MLVFLIYSVVLCLFLRKVGFFRLDNFHGFGIYAVLLIKLLVAIFLFYFPFDNMHDSQTYLHDSKELGNVFWQNPVDFFKVFFHIYDADALDWKYMLGTNFWSHETGGFLSEKRNVIRINAIFYLLGFENQYVVFLWNTLVALLGFRLFYLALRKLTADKHNLLFLLVFALPSSLLWTSNIMRENYLILGFGLTVYGMMNFGNMKKRILYVTLGLALMFLFRQYAAFACFVGLAVYVVLNIFQGHAKKWAMFALVIIGTGISYLILPKFTEKLSQRQFEFIQLAQGGIVLNDAGTFYHIDGKLEKHFNFFQDSDKNHYAHIIRQVEATRQSHLGEQEKVILDASDKKWYVFIHQKPSGSKIELIPIHNKTEQLVTNIPEALINALFRPWPNDPPNSILKWYFVLENCLVWGLFLFGMSKIGSNQNKDFLLFFVIAGLVMALIIGWTTPVLGAIVRYKMPVVLSLIAMSWLLLFPENHISQKELHE